MSISRNNLFIDIALIHMEPEFRKLIWSIRKAELFFFCPHVGWASWIEQARGSSSFSLILCATFCFRIMHCFHRHQILWLFQFFSPFGVYDALEQDYGINPFTPSPHNNRKPPHAELSEFDIAELTFGTSCRREGMGGGWRSERPVGVKGLMYFNIKMVITVLPPL